MSEGYKPKRAITRMTMDEIGPNQYSLIAQVQGIAEDVLLRRGGYESLDYERWYEAYPFDVIEVLL